MNPSSKSIPGGIAIGGIKGGSGKTLFAIGLIQALTRKGYAVSPFKKGPDYIDPAWLTLASGRQCRNLDAYLMSKDTLTGVYLSGSENSDFVIVEGNRGLFDGLDIDGTYSFAELVKWLEIPLILIMDCSKSSRTMSALVHGCESFDEDLTLKGIVLNQIAGVRHEKIITDSIKKYCRTPVLGALPRLSGLHLSERHLGLLPVSEHPDPGQVVKMLGDAVERNVDIEPLIQIAETGITNRGRRFLETQHSENIKQDDAVKSLPPRPVNSKNGVLKRPVVGVIKDSAFNFYYPENLEALNQKGADIIEINSISDEYIPEVDALYIGGGFPETHVQMLSKNSAFR
jgi:cobyrinic acid a,c-diamide synthase